MVPAALAAGPGSPERARYLFRQGRGRGRRRSRPNNWESVFGGPAWTRVARRRVVPPPLRHHPARPRLAQPRGGGDVRGRAALLARPRRRRLPGRRRARPVQGGEPARPASASAGQTRRRPSDRRARAWSSAPQRDEPMWDQPEVHDVYRAWRRILDGVRRRPDGRRRGLDPDARSRWRATCAPTSSSQAFNFAWLLAPWSARGLRRRASAGRSTRSAPVGAAPTWVLSNHDVVRHATRYGGGAVGLARARAATLTMLALPGSAYLYQGEELGLEEVDVPPEHAAGPGLVPHRRAGRDGCRVPMPWRGTRPPYGFGPAGRAALAADARRLGRPHRRRAAARTRRRRGRSTARRCGPGAGSHDAGDDVEMSARGPRCSSSAADRSRSSATADTGRSGCRPARSWSPAARSTAACSRRTPRSGCAPESAW